MVEIKSGNWCLRANPECGGNLSQVTWKNLDVMRPFTAVEEWEKAPTNYGFAVLFPPNRIDGGRFIFDSRDCFLPVNEPHRNNHLHGVALREKWCCSKVSENSIEMEFRFDNTSPMHEGYPFDSLLKVIYRAEDDTFEQRFEVENLCRNDIPCALGFHSAFAVPEKMIVYGEGGRFELVPPRYLASGREIAWEDGFAPSTWCDPKKIWPFGHLRAGDDPLAELEYEKFKVSYMPDEKFKYWMVWRPEFDTSFVCIEPMNIKIGTFENDPAALPVAEPGEKVVFTSKIKISEL